VCNEDAQARIPSALSDVGEQRWCLIAALAVLIALKCQTPSSRSHDPVCLRVVRFLGQKQPRGMALL
jgi:hypothetical protein